MKSAPSLIIATLLFVFSSSAFGQVTDTGGNVGIGTTSPKTNLHIFGTSSILRVGPNYTDSTGDRDFIELKAHPTDTKIISINERLHIDNPGGHLVLQNSNGNVGIGISSPSEKLDVNGKALINGDITSKSPNPDMWKQNGTAMIFNTADASGAKAQILSYTPDAGNNFDLRFFTGNGSNQTNNLTLKTGGNVGIGIDNPEAKLAVNGNIHTKEVKVDLIGWSDFVFYDDYKLPTLDEVENHIKDKGHLKDIPSAEEVVQNGIYLGEMDAKLLQKIEELTLYTIEQNKKTEELTLYTIEQEKKIKNQADKIENLELLNKKFIELQSRLEKLESN